MNIITRFSPGDEVFFFDNNVIVERTITKMEVGVVLDAYRIPSIALRYYFKDKDKVSVKHESQLYASRGEIAKAVLSYKI